LLKKIVSVFFLFVLIAPLSIQILHVLENHEHTVCTSKVEKHVHKQSFDCKELHKHLTFFTFDFTSNLDVIPAHFYASIFIIKPQIDKEIYQSIKSTRGPPIFTV
tara:strand:+ start:104 stop:418 length:315 start_codon:yes stop_codon:yes gene_type:complete